MALNPDVTTFGRRLLPHIIDERARVGYDRPYALYPRNKNPNNGFRSISYSQIANAINRAAWWLEGILGNEEEKENSFVYLGPNDLRYVILVVATMKTERKMLVTSLRNTVQAQLSLFERVNCRVLISCASLAQSLQPLFEASERLRKVQAPTLEELLNEETAPHYSFDRSYEAVANKKLLTFHTSGSSGNPKPITHSQAMICAVDTANLLPKGQGNCLTKEFSKGQNMLIMLPCFHAGGFHLSLYPAYFDSTVVLGHPDMPIAADYVLELLGQDVISSMIAPPSIIEDLSKSDEGIDLLARLDHIGYAGGPLSPNIGKLLAPRFPHLFSYIGATEYGWFHCISEGSQNWKSLRFFENIGYRFEEVSEGVFELLITRDSDHIKYHGNFYTFPDIQEYRTRDLYSPESPGLWTYRGRADDLIVLSNGEKINPIPMENRIRMHPGVRSVLVIGEYQFSPSLLVEMENSKVPETHEELRDALNDIWPTVEEANKLAPAFAKIPKSLILFSPPGKGFHRAGKGTVQRQATVKAYSQDLESLFGSQELELLIEGLSVSYPSSPESIKLVTREVCLEALATKGHGNFNGLSDSEDLFTWGLDSLSVMVIVRRLRAVMRFYNSEYDVEYIKPRLIYSSTSIEKIARAIIVTTPRNVVTVTPSSRPERVGRMETMLRKYTMDLPTVKHQNSIRERPWTVVLTGTTGSLGSYLLDALMRQPEEKVYKIYCLNRSGDAAGRQRRSNESRGLKSLPGNGRVEFLQSDLSRPGLGLTADKYAQLIDSTTVVIHCAWKVDFNLSIESFEPQVLGVRNLLNFSFDSRYKAPLTFISSISTVLEWQSNHPGEKVPSAVVHDFDAPEYVGYGESKYISERLLEEFSRNSGISTAVFRTGQIAGPISTKGSWNKQEWLPSLIASSKYLHVLPESLSSFEVIDWIPVDVLSDIMVDLVGEILKSRQGEGKTHVYNLVNPKAATWSNLLPTVQETLGITETSSLEEWVRCLEESIRHSNSINTEQNPAAKLVDFFQLLAKRNTKESMGYDVENLLQDSRGARGLEVVTPDWMRLWLQQWSF